MTKNKKIQILSYECFTGHPFSGGTNQIEIINRLKMFFPNATILLIFREQRNHIKSMYKKYIKDGGRKNIEYFLGKKQSLHNLSFRKSYLNYYDVITKYKEKFGKKKVLALPFELLNFSPQIFIKEISNFLNTNINLVQVKFEKLNESSQAGFLN